MPEARLIRTTLGDRNAVGGVHIGDPVRLYLIPYRPLQFLTDSLKKALPVAETPVLGVEPAIDEIWHKPIPRLHIVNLPC
ncbi:hypothetical protein FQZ97_1228770 [compost metagenome]